MYRASRIIGATGAAVLRSALSLVPSRGAAATGPAQQCFSTYNKWLRAHNPSTAAQRKAEVKKLNKKHHCHIHITG
jgi:hypothetical protein